MRQTNTTRVAHAAAEPASDAAVQALLREIGDLRGEVARLMARLSEVEGLADRDALTPLFNRRAFLRELARTRAFVQRYGGPASLVYFDLDGLKSVNDRYGHATGDAALRAVAERLLAQVRESDVVGRLGGDEFGVILAQADHAAAETKAQALASAIAAEPLAFGGCSTRLQLSFGVRQITGDLEPDAMLAQADAAMYRRKRGS